MTLKTKILAGVAALVAIPAFVVPLLAAEEHSGRHGGPMMMGMDPTKPVTRADVEAMVKTHFAALDGNKDGSVTREEAAAAHQARMADRRDAHFKAMDSNGDNMISRAEFDAQHPAPPPGGGQDDDDQDARGPSHRGDGHEGHGKRHGGRGGGRDGKGMGMHMMERADSNQDGKVTLVEALEKPLARFDSADSNKDGTLTPAERDAARQARRGR